IHDQLVSMMKRRFHGASAHRRPLPHKGDDQPGAEKHHQNIKDRAENFLQCSFHFVSPSSVSFFSTVSGLSREIRPSRPARKSSMIRAEARERSASPPFLIQPRLFAAASSTCTGVRP